MMEKVSELRAFTLYKFPMFGYPLCLLKVVQDKSTQVLATDGIHLFVGDRFLKLQKWEQVFALLHEAGHLLLEHFARQRGRITLKWNYACDYAINGMLSKLGVRRPKWVLYNSEYEDLTAEQIYERLPDPLKVIHFDHRELKRGLPKDVRVQARQMQKSYGSDKGSQIEEFFADDEERTLVELPLPIHDFKIRRPRPSCPDLVVPRIDKQKPRVCICLDASGSIDRELFGKFVAEATQLSYWYEVLFRVFDTEVQMETCDPEEIKFQGRGGTSFGLIFDGDFEVFLVFTDLCGSFPEKPPEVPVCWIVPETCTEPDPPFGEVMRLGESFVL